MEKGSPVSLEAIWGRRENGCEFLYDGSKAPGRLAQGTDARICKWNDPRANYRHCAFGSSWR